MPYQELQVAVDALEYVEAEGQIYHDSRQIDTRWKNINRDGSRDRRFKVNYQLPVVRCGILGIDVGQTTFHMMTTNPDVPDVVQRKLMRLKGPVKVIGE